jgi:hypothetical protein
MELFAMSGRALNRGSKSRILMSGIKSRAILPQAIQGHFFHSHLPAVLKSPAERAFQDLQRGKFFCNKGKGPSWKSGSKK